MKVHYVSATRIFLAFGFLLAAGCALSGTEGAKQGQRSFHTLEADRVWQLDFPGNGRFDASGLLALPGGELLTINDRNSDLFRIEPAAGKSARVLATEFFPPELVREAAISERRRYDCEGIARDEQGRLYICEEMERTIYRWDGKSGEIERLEIDWTPVASYFQGGINASFEGVAAGGGRLYVANERSNPVIIVVDLETLAVVDHFTVRASGFALGGPHYSDLSWFDGHLYVLDRNHRAVLRVNPKTREVVAEFSFGTMELEHEVAYRTDYPTGTMEGLAVTAEHLWLVTDNNGRGRVRFPKDPRPTLFRCQRPDRKPPTRGATPR